MSAEDAVHDRVRVARRPRRRDRVPLDELEHLRQREAHHLLRERRGDSGSLRDEVRHLGRDGTGRLRSVGEA